MRRKHSSIVLLILFLLLSLPSLAAQNPGSLFVSSDPMKAAIRLDGIPQAQSTPCLIRSLSAGAHTVEISREGLVTQSVEIEVLPDRAVAVAVALPPRGVVVAFPSQSHVVLAGEPVALSGQWVHLEGFHTVDWHEGTGVRLDPAFREQSVIDALNISIPFFLAFTGLITAEAVLNPQDIDWPLPPAVLASQVVTAALMGADIYFYSRKKKHVREYRAPYLTESADGKLQRAESLLSRAEVDQARAAYEEIILEHPDSAAYPRALYRLATMDALQGRLDVALESYVRIVRDYPVPDLYDRANKAAADILYSRGQHSESLAHLEQMVFWDRFYSPEQIEVYKQQIAADAASAQSPNNGRQ